MEEGEQVEGWGRGRPWRESRATNPMIRGHRLYHFLCDFYGWWSQAANPMILWFLFFIVWSQLTSFERGRTLLGYLFGTIQMGEEACSGDFVLDETRRSCLFSFPACLTILRGRGESRTKWSKENGIRDACSTAEILTAPHMPQMMPQTCPI